MVMEHGVYEGRRGSRRLKAIEKHKEKLLAEFKTSYDDSREMIYMRENVRWEGVAELLFIMARRNVHFRWNGLRDYGFLSLCMKWIEKEPQAMTPKAAEEMIRSILPEEMWQALSEELEALELI